MKAYYQIKSGTFTLMSVAMPFVAFVVTRMPVKEMPDAFIHSWLPGFIAGWFFATFVDLVTDRLVKPHFLAQENE